MQFLKSLANTPNQVRAVEDPSLKAARRAKDAARHAQVFLKLNFTWKTLLVPTGALYYMPHAADRVVRFAKF